MKMAGALDQPSLVANPPRPKGESTPPARRAAPPPAFREERQKPRASLVERLALVFTVPRCVLEDPHGLSHREWTEKQII